MKSVIFISAVLAAMPAFGKDLVIKPGESAAISPDVTTVTCEAEKKYPYCYIDSSTPGSDGEGWYLIRIDSEYTWSQLQKYPHTPAGMNSAVDALSKLQSVSGTCRP